MQREIILVQSISETQLNNFLAGKLKFGDKLRKLSRDLEFQRMKQDIFYLFDDELDFKAKEELKKEIDEIILIKVKMEVIRVAFKDTIVTGKPVLVSDEYLTDILEQMWFYKALKEIKEELENKQKIKEIFESLKREEWGVTKKILLN